MQKVVRLKGDALYSLVERLREAGFTGGSWKWGNANLASPIREIELGFQLSNPRWVYLYAFPSGLANLEQIEAELANLHLYPPDHVVSDEQARAELERELLATESYWNRTIKSYVQEKTRSVSQWWVTRDARDQLRSAAQQVASWNQSQRPITAALPDLDDAAFREPELTIQDSDLQRHLESSSLGADLPPDEAAERRLADFLAGRRLFNALPNWGEMMCPEFRSVGFDEIIRSNETHGHLPLLPPVEADGAARLSKEKIEMIVVGFLKDHGAGHDEIDACRSQRAILLPSLCCLRRERFDEHGHSPEMIFVSRPRSEPAADTPRKLEVDEMILWRVLQKIMDDLDPTLKAAPMPSQVFIRFCRDRMTLAAMRRRFGWKRRTLINRRSALERFLRTQFAGLTLEAFFVDRSIFNAAERQLDEHRAKHLSRRKVAECEIDENDG